jgi:hypothetical protein
MPDQYSWPPPEERTTSVPHGSVTSRSRPATRSTYDDKSKGLLYGDSFVLRMRIPDYQH